jgi:hypothetical protein
VGDGDGYCMIPTDAALSLLLQDAYTAAPAAEVYTAGIDHAVIYRRTDHTVLAIPGTQDMAQWVSNFKLIGVHAATHPQLGICEDGFLAGAQALWDVVGDKLGNLPIVMVTHSRAAGMGPIIAGLALLDGIRFARCVLFEKPWCCGLQLKEFIIQSGVPGIEFWHGDDPIPLVPAVPWLVPNVWGIKHFGEWQLDPFACHLMAGIVADMQAVAHDDGSVGVS